MRILDKNDKNYFRQITDYYPLINPFRLQKETNVSIPSKTDIKAAKDWVDSNYK